MQSRKPNHHKNQQKSVRKNNEVQGETNDECEHLEWLEQHQTNVKAAPALFFLTSCTVFGRPLWWVIDIVLNKPPRKGVRSVDFGGHCIGHTIFHKTLVPRVDILLGRSFARMCRNCHCTFTTHLIPWKVATIPLLVRMLIFEAKNIALHDSQRAQ